METIGLYALIAASLGLQAATMVTVKRRSQVTIKGGSAGTIILDTCALIDGRIQDLVKAGFVTQQLFIPQRVVEELQFLADHGDAHKRSRARFGLDVAQALQESVEARVTIVEGGAKDMPVDDVLIMLAKQYGAALYTTDYNLNKVARIHGVNVLNVNELAHAIRPIHLPGEKVTVKIVQKGESKTQGVGYLEDGTMAVIEGAANQIGSQVSASIERMLQTEAGKMVFAKSERAERQSQASNKPQANGNKPQQPKPQQPKDPRHQPSQKKKQPHHKKYSRA